MLMMEHGNAPEQLKFRMLSIAFAYTVVAPPLTPLTPGR
jgi:hypothetical protein